MFFDIHLLIIDILLSEQTQLLFQLEGIYKNHPVQLPDQFRADQMLKHVIKGIVQTLLKHWRAWGVDHLPRDLFQC